MEPTYERINRLSDLQCSAHAVLRDQFKLRAGALSLLVLAVSTWLLAMVFVEPRIGVMFTPGWFEKDVWLGLLTIVTFLATVVELKLDWRAKAEAHGRAVTLFAQLKHDSAEAKRIAKNDEAHITRIGQQYRFVCEMSPQIPEARFVRLKQHHKRKVAISRYLDTHPYASLALIRLRWWLRDNTSRLDSGTAGTE